MRPQRDGGAGAASTSSWVLSMFSSTALAAARASFRAATDSSVYSSGSTASAAAMAASRAVVSTGSTNSP